MTEFDITKPVSRQLAASIKMLETAIERATDEVWTYGQPPFWQIAYHTLAYLDFYLSTFDPEISDPSENYRLPGEMQKHVGSHYFDKKPTTIVSKDEMTSFLKSTRERISGYFSSEIHQQLGEESDFPWLPMNKYELILYNIRHTMEHTAIMSQYLKEHGIEASGWVGIAELL